MTAHEDSVDAEKPTDVGVQRTWRVWLILALWIFLLVQGAVVALSRYTGTEAYPMIAMPGFNASDIGANGQARVTERKIEVIDANGGLHSVTATALLAPMPTNPANATLDRIAGQWKKDRRQTQSADSNPRVTLSPALSAETTDYLKRQTEQLALNPRPIGLRIVWQPETLDMRSLQRTPAGEPTVWEVRW